MAKYRFKLLRGRHSQVEPNPAGGPPIQRFYAAKVFDKTGDAFWARNEDPKEFADPPDEVESDDRLDEMFNQKNGSEPKFQLIGEGGTTTAVAPTNAPPAHVMSDGLDAMTVRQLQELAAGEEIALPKSADKQTLIDTIRASR